jgi:hypothetical protein
MDILLILAGTIIAFYTLSSVAGFWLSQQIMEAQTQGMAIPEALAEAEDHHIELMATYALGWRRHAWTASIIALMTTLLAMLTQSQLAFWALGAAIGIDALLFGTYRGQRAFLAHMSAQERLLDSAQSLVLLATFAVLFFVHQSAS